MGLVGNRSRIHRPAEIQCLAQVTGGVQGCGQGGVGLQLFCQLIAAPTGMAGDRHDPSQITGGQQGPHDIWPLLVGQHADHPVARPRGQAVALGAGIQLGPQRRRRWGVVGAIKQQRHPPPTELLQATWPACCSKTGADRSSVERPAACGQGLAKPQGHGSVGRLHRTSQPAGAPLTIDQHIASGVLGQGINPAQLRPTGRGLSVQHGRHHGGLGGADRCRACLQHTRLFGRDAGQIGTQKLAVIEADAGQADHTAIAVAGGGIQPTAQPHLEHHQGQSGLGKRQKCRRSDQFKGCQPMGPCHGSGRLELAAQSCWGDRLGTKPNALGPALQVRRGIQPGPNPGRQQHPVHEGADRPLAIGAGHLNRRKAPLGMTEVGQGRLQPLKPEIDAPPAERLNQISKVVVAQGIAGTQHRPSKLRG